MKEDEKIAVIAGNYDQFQTWLRQNIIPIVCEHDLKRLKGVGEIDQVVYVGTWPRWFTERVDAEIRWRLKH